MPVWLVGLMLATGAALLAAYVAHGRRTDEPIIDLTLVRIPTFRYSLIGSVLFRIGVGATPFLLPLFLQLGFGMTPFQSGMITFAAAVGAIVMKFVAPPVLRRYGFRSVLLANTVAASAFVTLPALFTPATPVALMTGLLLIGGFFRSLQFTSVNALAFADVEPARLSRATTLTSVAQQLSLSIGISIGAVALELASRAVGGLTAEAFWPAFVVVGAISLTALFAFRNLPADAGDEMSGRRALPDPVTVMRERG
jgi:MFS family permease